MFSLNGLGEYEAKINGITFIYDEADSASSEIKAAAIAKCYKEKLDEIVKFMMNEGITEYFGDISVNDIIKNLGFPIINLDRNTVTYPDNNFDDMLIIEFRFNGVLENFYGLDIDG